MNIKKAFVFIFSIPKSIWCNVRYLPLKKAVKFPLWVRWNSSMKISGKLEIPPANQLKRFYIRIGVDGSEHINTSKCRILLKKGTLQINGKADIALGSCLRIDGGTLVLGDNFSCNRNCNISCSNEVIFDKDALLGWNVFVRDTDGHLVSQNGIPKELSKPVHIGKHVWICSFSDVLKGAIVKDNSVVAWKACVLKPIEEENVLIGGFPAKILQRDITWDK